MRSRSMLGPMLSVAVAATVVLAGCGPSTTTTDGVNGLAADSQLNTVVESKKLRVAVLPDYPPFAVQNASGTLEGYEIDVAQALADAMGATLELTAIDGSARLATLTSGRVDVVIAAWTATDERAKTVDFTIPYVAAGSLPLFRKDNPITSLADLAGKKVSVARGSTDDTLVTNYFPDTEVVRFETIANAIAALKAGKVDAVMEGNTTVKDEAAKDSSLAVLDIPVIRPALISMGVITGDQVWKNYLDNFIRNLTASGTNQDLYMKWFETDLPSVIAYQP
ncbi:MAG: transporter substrate-binding domain-containing protein [Aeromicrobium sp.]